MGSISLLNPKAEVARAAQALAVNISAAKGIQDVMRTNLGPKGTMKMWVKLIFSDFPVISIKFMLPNWIACWVGVNFIVQ